MTQKKTGRRDLYDQNKIFGEFKFEAVKEFAYHGSILTSNNNETVAVNKLIALDKKIY